jgi:hypothetical protein
LTKSGTGIFLSRAPVRPDTAIRLGEGRLTGQIPGKIPIWPAVERKYFMAPEFLELFVTGLRLAGLPEK